MTIVAIALAVLAAVALAYGALYQHDAVAGQNDSHNGLSWAHFKELLSNRKWLIGLTITGLGTLGNIGALAMAPVMVVQPIGAFSLIVSVLLGVRHRGLKVNRRLVQAVVWCTVGVTIFVALSATTARTNVHLGSDALPLVWITAAVVLVGLGIMVFFRRAPQLVLITAAGLLFACVATNTHLVSVQLLRAGFDQVTWLNVIGLVAATAIGSWFVQNAYAAGPPEMVIAGLTVIDPIGAVILGSIVLGEAATAPAWLIVVIAATGLVACLGVVVLSRYHPDVHDREHQRRVARRTDRCNDTDQLTDTEES
ncbi:MAG: multidrug transporter [Brevibacterium sp.]|uniref:DMT family transporter n=1 Tax=Brevibacterium sp. TaxID=1701 RepID=UPI0026481838|nr:DMT family transporter [Brevibacterium sp.]MDN5806149.1 multidrug transporter [Brevibacterium sp.]MDN5832657.1 multidrug transporter [Brevibacterium sp.]MDN5875481.1 multidrug transporter [Brevibacterium sp.]MDN5908481.1 multidrug transporter [Brevibacterium sp.]MDN6123183.1 multidrug transporter [Brevibacterium sp.]